MNQHEPTATALALALPSKPNTVASCFPSPPALPRLPSLPLLTRRRQRTAACLPCMAAVTTAQIAAPTVELSTWFRGAGAEWCSWSVMHIQKLSLCAAACLGRCRCTRTRCMCCKLSFLGASPGWLEAAAQAQHSATGWHGMSAGMGDCNPVGGKTAHRRPGNEWQGMPGFR